MKIGANYFFMAITIAFLLPILLVLTYNIYIDPFQIVHKDTNPPAIILGGRGADRYQQAGIINQYEINSMIIGNSHSANYLPSKAQSILGWDKAYTLTMDGATIKEQSTVAKHALNNHDVKNVLWGISGLSLLSPWNTLNTKLPLKSYLYDENRLNDLAFYLTFDLQQYWEKKIERKAQSTDALKTEEQEFDKATTWYTRNINHFNRPAFVAKRILGNYKLIEHDRAPLPSTCLSDITNTKVGLSQYTTNYNDSFTLNILPLIAENIATQFSFVITAFPTLKMLKMKVHNNLKYQAYLRAIRQFVIDTNKMKNVKVYGFDLESFTDDLRLYKDPGHYHIEVNNYILGQISHKNNILSSDNIDTYIRLFDQKVSNYKLPEKWNPDLGAKVVNKGYLSSASAQHLINKPVRPEKGPLSINKEGPYVPLCR